MHIYDIDKIMINPDININSEEIQLPLLAVQQKREVSSSVNDMNNNNYFPLVNEENFVEKLLVHSEFYELIQNTLDSTKIVNAKEKVAILKARLMNESISLKPYQQYVSRFISSFTPYESLLIFHSPGSGKTLSLLNILKNNIEYFVNQNSLVYIFVPRRLLRMQWMQAITQYFPELAGYIVISTYKSLYNKIIGERKLVIDEQTLKQKRRHATTLEVSYQDYENCILVLEEAHNVTNNNYTLAINKLRENVRHKKTICLTATPIKNNIDEIIDLFNFLHTDRRLVKQDYFEYINGRPTIANHEKLVKDMTGYVSTLNINESPYLAKRIQIGKLIDGLTDIRVIVIKCSDNYRKIIDRVLAQRNDSLGRIFESLSNIIFPYFVNGKLTFLYGNRGYELLSNELSTNNVRQFNKMLCSLLHIPENTMLLTLYTRNDSDREKQLAQQQHVLTGHIFSRKYINFISPKMRFTYDLIQHLDGNIFIYSSYKRIFIDLFAEVLLNEGYQDYRKPERGYEALKKCYACGTTRSAHTSLSHSWQPLTFFVVDSADPMLMDTLNIYNSATNIDGRYIKIIMASVMVNEGISLKNTFHVINVDAQSTISRKEQIERRAIRLDSHDDYILRHNKIPNVYIYNLALYHAKSSVPSIEISMYKLAESKYTHVRELYKLIERASIDYGVYTVDNNQINERNSKIAKKLINSTRSLVNKDSRIENVIKYIVTIFTNVNVMPYKQLIAELQLKFDDTSILIATNTMIESEKIFIVSMGDKEIYIFSNMINAPDAIDERFLDIHSYYKIERVKQGSDLFYDMDYINSKTPYELCGIVSNKFKLKMNNEFIDKLKLSFVKTRHEQKQIMKGWICSQSVGKDNLNKLIDYLGKGDKLKDENSQLTCDFIYDILYNMEKYSDDNRQFLIYPKNHPNIPSILNVHDRANVTAIQYESKGYTVRKSKIDTSKFVHLANKAKYRIVTYKLTCTSSSTNDNIDVLIE